MSKKEQRTQKILSARDSLFKGCLLMLMMLFLSISATKAHNGKYASTDKVEEGSVTLQVTDALTGEPILGAVVKDSNGKTYVTNESGICIMKLSNTDKNVKVTVSFVGYKSYTSYVSAKTRTLNIKLKEDVQQLSGVTVTSKKRHTDIMQQAKVLDQSVLEKGGATSLAKMLESIPGVSSISAGNTVAKPVIQGMHSSRILLMNNGVKLESQSWGNDHAPEIDYTGASMVEVVKGAECIRYGFGAMGGVVLLNDAPLPYGHNKPIVKGVTNIGYDTNPRGISGSGSIEAGWKNFGMRLFSKPPMADMLMLL